MKASMFFIIFFLMISSIICANIIEDDLYYMQDYKSFYNLKSDDFEDFVALNTETDIEAGKLAVQFYFADEMKYEYLTLLVNKTEIEDLYYIGKADTKNNSFRIELKNKHLIPGKNKVEMVYYNHGKEERMKWSFMIGGELKNEFNIPIQLTQGSGWKRSIQISPDGNFIAYVMLDKDSNAIKLFDLRNNNDYIIIESEVEKKFGSNDEDKSFSFAPCWSRTGEYIFFVSTVNISYEIYRARISLDGEISEIRQLTDYGSYCTDLAISPNEDKLFFASNKNDGKMEIYVMENAEIVENSIMAKNNVHLISDEYDNHSAFAPTISYDGSYIAYCQQSVGENTEIVITGLNGNGLDDVIKKRSSDCLYPKWSPSSNLLAYFRDRQIFISDVLNDLDEIKIPSKIAFPTYAIKPSWDPSGNSLYYIKNDDNNSISQTIIDIEKFEIVESKDLLNDKYYRDNNEVAMSPDLENLIYNSFSSGTRQVWALKQNSTTKQSFGKISTKQADIPIKKYSRTKSKFELIALSPETNNSNSFLEIDQLSVGTHSFMIGENVYYESANKFSGITIENDLKFKEKFPVKPLVLSTLLPGLGQKSIDQHDKAKYFGWSFLGLAAVGGGSYFLADHYHTEYGNSDNLEDLINNRNKYKLTNSITNGIISTASILYCMNLFDVIFTPKNTPPEYKEQHRKTYYQIKSKRPVSRPISAKVNNGTGELKVFSNEPKTKLYISGNGKDNVYVGKTNYVFNKDTFFTVTDLTPGDYKLTCEKAFYSPQTKDISIKEYEVNYQLINMEQTKFDKLKMVGKSAVPGYVQFTRDNKVKGYTISGLAGTFLLGSLISQLEVNNDIDRYNNARTTEKIVESKEDYYGHATNRDTYLVLLGLTWLYSIYDAVIGE